MQRIILHLDMNSYFASVEQQANPFLRNKPVGVCAYLSENGCIIASSIEAKKLGVKTGLRVKEAKKICPDVILVENDPNKYRTVTAKLFKILTDYSSDFEPYSIDEAFLDLTGMAGSFDEAVKTAGIIRQRITSEIGEWLRCSIGISYTKFLAKLCSDTAQKGSIKVFKNTDSLDQLYSGLKLTDIWGIGIRLESRLNGLGIYSPADLKNYPRQNLMQVFGKPGYFLWAKVNGLEVEDLKGGEELLSKSIGHSYCLAKQSRDKKYLASVLFKLAEKTGRRLRERQQAAGGLYIYWSYLSGNSYSLPRATAGAGKSFKLKSPVCSTEEIFNKTYKVLDQAELKDKIRMLAVGVFNLMPLTSQLSLFVNQDNDKLTKAVDKINSTFGDQVIYRGRLWKTQSLARDRIGFRKVVPPLGS